MFRSMLPARSALRTVRPQAAVPSSVIAAPSLSLFGRRGYASQSEEHDLVIIGGGVAGYVAAIKAGQEGLKVRFFLRLRSSEKPRFNKFNGQRLTCDCELI